jgi:hypothetical protein
LLPEDGERPLDEFVPLLPDGYLDPTLFKIIQKIVKKCRKRAKNTVQKNHEKWKNSGTRISKKRPRFFPVVCTKRRQTYSVPSLAEGVGGEGCGVDPILTTAKEHGRLYLFSVHGETKNGG